MFPKVEKPTRLTGFNFTSFLPGPIVGSLRDTILRDVTMAKYKLRAKETFETVVPADVIIFRHLITGEQVGDPVPVPERRWTTEKDTSILLETSKIGINALSLVNGS